jgi:phosphoglycolate phosphatase
MPATHYSHILFDLDGTIADPYEGMTKSIQYAINKMGMDEPLEALSRFIGPPLHISAQKEYGFSEEKALELLGYYRERYKEIGIAGNRLYDGIPELLKDLRAHDKKIFLATSKPNIFANQILEKFSIAAFFYRIVGSNLDTTLSNKGEIITHILETETHAEKADFVMIGDRDVDIIGAHKNGIDSIGVLYGYGSRTELENVHPTHIAETVNDVRALLL